jgi:RNA polymerase sigma-54 factor
LYEKSADQKEKAYLKEKISGARFIIDAIAQRRRTLLKIVKEIIKYQTAFLEQGVEQLRPLMRQDIADKIGMHVATVSRAVKDKYIQTPSGVLALSSFFSGGIATQDGGEAESSKSVKLKILKLIESEDKKNPLSDQDIADKLARDGLDISRRTVTKYRIADGIPSTRQRRDF